LTETLSIREGAEHQLEADITELRKELITERTQKESIPSIHAEMRYNIITINSNYARNAKRQKN
jgi:hypothetical protein